MNKTERIQLEDRIFRFVVGIIIAAIGFAIFSEGGEIEPYRKYLGWAVEVFGIILVLVGTRILYGGRGGGQ